MSQPATVSCACCSWLLHSVKVLDGMAFSLTRCLALSCPGVVLVSWSPCCGTGAVGYRPIEHIRVFGILDKRRETCEGSSTACRSRRTTCAHGRSHWRLLGRSEPDSELDSEGETVKRRETPALLRGREGARAGAPDATPRPPQPPRPPPRPPPRLPRPPN